MRGQTIRDHEGSSKAFHAYYIDLLDSSMVSRKRLNMQTIHAGPILDVDSWSLLDLNFSSDEMKEAIWSIDDNKTPGLDGFNSKFYKASWPIFSQDVIKAIQDFLATGKILKSWNNTAITLIPKVPCPSTPGDYKPISCCHTLYKCIFKLICSRWKRVFGKIINHTRT